MSENQLPLGRVFLIQLRLMLSLGWRGRSIGFGLVFIQLVAMVLFGVVLGVSINSEGVRVTQVVDFAETLELPLTRGTGALLVALVALCVVAWFGPFKLWDGEAPRKREYHWAMPVAKGRHDIARVLAGLVILLGWAVALYGSVVLLVVLGGGDGAGGAFAGVPPLAWLCLFIGPVLSYLLTSFFTVRMEHPSGWLWSIFGVVAAIATLASVLRIEPIGRWIETLLFGSWGLVSAVVGPVGSAMVGADGPAGGAWLAAWLGWFLFLSAAVVWAAHDRRRLP